MTEEDKQKYKDDNWVRVSIKAGFLCRKIDQYLGLYPDGPFIERARLKGMAITNEFIEVEIIQAARAMGVPESALTLNTEEEETLADQDFLDLARTIQLARQERLP